MHGVTYKAAVMSIQCFSSEAMIRCSNEGAWPWVIKHWNSEMMLFENKG